MPMRYVTDPCPEPQAFVFKTGARARSLQELKQTIDQAPPDVVQYHRDHFHHWVRDILQEPQLAERIRAEGQRNPDGEQLRRSLDKIVEPYLPRPSAPGQGGLGGGQRRAGGILGKR